MIERGRFVRDLLACPAGTEVTAHGWVKTRRDSKGVHFLKLNDGSSQRDLQVVVDDGVVPAAVLNLATTGACVRVVGQIVASPAAEQPVELRARELEVYGSADPAT